MEKIVIIINGKGGVGKDTLIGFAEEKFCVKNVSAITPIKKIAEIVGWSEEKDEKSRRFLSDLKKLVVEYNDYPTIYLFRKYAKFMKSRDQILFMHIREIEEIEKIKKYLPTRCCTLLVSRNTGKEILGNASDDNVDNYQYDYYFDNNESLPVAKKEFIELIRKIIDQ